MLPPSDQAKLYRSMYAFGNHVPVRSAQAQLTTTDFGAATTFRQLCRSDLKDTNPKVAELEYVGWVEEILSVDYGLFEVVVLYCNWVAANMKGDGATMKHDEYGFTTVNFERLIPYSARSFAFRPYIEQVLHPTWPNVDGKLFCARNQNPFGYSPNNRERMKFNT